MNEIGDNELEMMLDMILCEDRVFVQHLLEGASEYERVEFLKEFPECLEMLNGQFCFS